MEHGLTVIICAWACGFSVDLLVLYIFYRAATRNDK